MHDWTWGFPHLWFDPLFLLFWVQQMKNKHCIFYTGHYNFASRINVILWANVCECQKYDQVEQSVMNPNRWVASNPSRPKPSNVNIKRGIYLFQYILMKHIDTKKKKISWINFKLYFPIVVSLQSLLRMHLPIDLCTFNVFSIFFYFACSW